MEAGGGLDVGHVFARLDAKLDESNFKRFDAAVDRSRAKTRGLTGDQDRLRRSTETLSREQARQASFLRSQGHSWESVAQQVGVSEDALKHYNTTSRTTVRENERVRRSNRDTEKSFGGVEGGISRANRVASFFSKTLKLIKWPALISGAGLALQAINALAAGTIGLTSALAPLSGLLVTLPAALGTFGQALGVAGLSLMGVKKAVEALNSEEVKGAKTAEDSAKKRRTAATQIRSANEQLADAERTEKGAVLDLAEARREAVRTLQDQRNAAVDARLAERGSELGLRRAIVELRKAQADPKTTILELEELELRVSEARQGLKEARLDNKRAQEDNRKAQRGGIKGDPAVVEARKQLAEAERNVAQASRGVSEAQRDARESLNETDAAANKVRETFAKLTPEAKHFSLFLYGLKPQLKDLQATAAKGFLPGAEKGIKDTLQNLPVVNRVIGATSRVLGNLSERAGRFFGSKGFGRDLETIGKGNARILGLMGRSAEHLFAGLTKIMVVAQPLLRFVGKYTNHLSAWIEKTIEVNRKNGDLARFFGRTRQVVEVLTSIFQSLGATLHVIGEESGPLGRQILAAFDEGAQGLEKWAESVEGRHSIARYFKEAKGPLFEFGRLVRDVFGAFFEVSQGQSGNTRELIHQLRTELLPVLTEVLKSTTASFGPHLIEMITQVLGLFARLAGSSGPLTLYVDSLTTAAEIINTLLDSVPGLRGLTVNLLGLVAVMKTITTIGQFTGITKGLELIFGPELGARLKGKFKDMLVNNVLKPIFVRGALATNLVYTWGSEIAGQIAGGISKQVGKVKAVARRMAIAFIGIFAPEVAAGMAAGGRLGEVLSEKFPKVAGMFKGGGKLAGRAFLVGVLLGAVLIGVELGNMINKQWPDLGPSMRRFGIRAGEWLVNGLIDAVNLGIRGLNTALDKANILGKLGVDAPNIGEVGHVNWHSRGERDKRAAENIEKETGRPAVSGPGGKPIPSQTPKEIEELNERLHRRRRRRRRRRAETTSLTLDGGGDEALLFDPEAAHRRRGGKKPEDEAKDTRKKVTDQHRKLRQDVEGETNRLQQSVLDRFGKIRKGGSEETTRLDKSVTGSVQDMRTAHDRSTKAMLTATDTRFAGMRTIVSQRSSKMREDLGGNVGEMNRVTTEGMDQIQAATVRALKAFGVKNVDLNLTPHNKNKPKSGPRKAAQGGVFTVPGEGLQDTVYLPGVHAMVAPGEDLFVATRHQQPLLDLAIANTFPGLGGLDDFFSAFNRPHYMAEGGRAPRGYAGGGNVVLDPGVNMRVGQEPQILRDLKALSAELGKVVYVISGYRSPAHSVAVGGFANDPHTRGEAADIGVGSPLLDTMFGVSEAALKAVGLYRPFYPADAHEVNHVQLLAGGPRGRGVGPAGAGAAGASARHIKAPGLRGRKGTFRTLAEAALARTTEGANEYIDKRSRARMRSLGGVGGINVSVANGPIQKMAREMVSQIWGPGEFGAFNALELSEAGWNPRAENPESGAAGLAQALPPSKYPPGAWPYRGIRSARLQLEWMMSYIKERYGSPAAAWSFHQANNWYARGGRALRRFASGGSFKGNINHRYAPHWAPDYGGATLPSYVVAALAESAGRTLGHSVPGRTMEQVTRGESGAHRKNSARPGSAGVDAGGTKGYGMWAITSPFANSIVRKYGGYPSMWNPVKNAAAMVEVFSQNGLGAWYGTGSVTGSNLHYKGNYDIRRALGGLSFKEALKGRSSPGRESIQAESRRANERSAGGKRRREPKTGISSASFASAPRGRYSPAVLLKVMAQTGIGLPYALMMNGVPNWKGLSPQRYKQIVDGYYKRVAEYRKTLSEERSQAAESWKQNPLLGTVTTLTPDMMAAALRFHAPIASSIGAYQFGLGALGSLDARAEATRSSYLNTFTESYLRPYRAKESLAEYIHTGTLKSINPAEEAKAFSEAKLKGLHKRIQRFREGKKHGPKAQSSIAAAEVAKGRRKHRKRAGRRFARGGRVLGHFAKGGKSKAPISIKGIRKKTQQEIRRHNEKVRKRAERRRRRADKRYEEEGEGVLEPVEREREELEEREQYETARREELATLLSEVAGNVQKTAIVGTAQSSIFDSSTFFARGGSVPPAAAPPQVNVSGGNHHVTVPLSVRLSGALEALNPHIEALVDGKLRDLGRAAGGAQATVSAPGRRVSYGGK